MNEDFANCAKFHRRVKSALALGKYHDWEHFRDFEGEIIERLCDLEFRSWLYLFSCFLFSYFLFSIHFSLVVFPCFCLGAVALVLPSLSELCLGFGTGRASPQ